MEDGTWRRGRSPGPKTYVAEAYGVKFNPPLAQAEVGALIGKLGLAMREYENDRGCKHENA